MTWSAMVHSAKSNVLRNWMQWWQKKRYWKHVRHWKCLPTIQTQDTSSWQLVTRNQPCFQIQWLDDMSMICVVTLSMYLWFFFLRCYTTKVFRVVRTDPCRACGQLYRQLTRKILQIWVMMDKYPNTFWWYFRKTHLLPGSMAIATPMYRLGLLSWPLT